MKKILVWSVMLSMICSSGAMAQMPVTVPGMMAPSDLVKIGVVAAAKGQVELKTGGQAGRVVQSGESVYIGDLVTTDSRGHLQILLLDQTVFTIGPNSAITIDEFVYDPKTEDGKMRASIAKGVFRYVSGKIAAKKPSNVQIDLPNATIGIRGTIVAGEAGSQGSFAMLLGPGERNDAGATVGSFHMQGTGENTGGVRNVNRTGFGVEANASGTLSNVFQVPDVRVSQLANGLLPSQNQQAPGTGQGGGGNGLGPGPGGPLQPGGGPVGGPGPGGMGGNPPPGGMLLGGDNANVGQMSGANNVAMFGMLGDFKVLGSMVDGLNKNSIQGAQDAAQQAAQLPPPPTNVSVTQLEDARFVERTGVFHYQHFLGAFLYDAGSATYPGVMKASVEMDFESSVNSGHMAGTTSPNYTQSFVEINVPAVELNDHCILSSQSFTGTGDATMQWSNVTSTHGGSFDVTVTLQNVELDGQKKIAEQAKVGVGYSNSTNSGCGNMIAAIQSGPTDTPPPT